MRRILVLAGLAMIAGCASEVVVPQGYCYASLADVVCYDKPDEGREGRLVGTLEPAPQ